MAPRKSKPKSKGKAKPRRAAPASKSGRARKVAARSARLRARTTARSSARPASHSPARGTSRSPAHAAKAPAAPASAPNAIGFASQHMDYTTHNLDGVKRFYTELLGFSGFRYMPEGPYLAIQTGPSSSLGFMPPRPGPPEQWQPPREPTIYLMVEDVDRAYSDLISRGVMFESEPKDMPWGHRVALLRDPEGRSVQLAQMKR